MLERDPMDVLVLWKYRPGSPFRRAWRNGDAIEFSTVARAGCCDLQLNRQRPATDKPQ